MTGERKRCVGRGAFFSHSLFLAGHWVSAPSDSGMLNLVEVLSMVVMSKEEPHPLQWSQVAPCNLEARDHYACFLTSLQERAGWAG